jgi:hypothetical protein
MMSTLFRAKLIDGLSALYEQRKLSLSGSCAHLNDPHEFRNLKNDLFKEPWVVYCKRPFAGAQQLFEYLSRYTHRVGISNYRLQDVAIDHVTFSTKNGRSTTVTPHEFIRRFLLHVLPKGWQKIRHYGLLASANVNTKLEVARSFLQPDAAACNQRSSEATAPDVEDTPALEDWREQLLALTGVDLKVCPRCRRGRMIPRPIPKDTS